MKKKNNIKILLATTISLSLFSLNINAMKKNSAKQNVLSKSFKNKETKTNIFEKSNFKENKSKKPNSVDNMKNNLTLKKDEQKNIKKFNSNSKNMNSEILDNLNKLNKLKNFEDEYEQEKHRQQILDKINKIIQENRESKFNLNNLNNFKNKSYEQKKKLDKINKIIQNTTEFNFNLKNINSKILDNLNKLENFEDEYEQEKHRQQKILINQQYEELNNYLKLFSNNISSNMKEICNIIYDKSINSEYLKNIIKEKIIYILSNIPLGQIVYIIENYEDIDKNLLKSIKKNIKEIKDPILILMTHIQKSYEIYSIYLNYYKNIDETDIKNLGIPFPLKEEQIDLCKKIDKIEEKITNHIEKLKAIDKKIEEIEILIKIKLYQKENEDLFKKSKEELENIFKEMIEKFKNEDTNLTEDFQKINDDFSLNERKLTNLHNKKEKLEQKLSKETIIEKINEKLKLLEENDFKLKESRDKILKKCHKTRESIEILEYILEKNLLDEKETKKFIEKSEESLKLELEKLKEEKYKLKKEKDEIFNERNILHLKEVEYNNKIINNNDICRMLDKLEEYFSKFF